MALFLLKALGLVRNCWFCSLDQRVPWSDRAGWTCAACDQYNGFTSDGDYNRDMTEMRNDDVVEGSNAESKPSENGLCDACNLHQELKRTQLARFEPSKEDRYEQEVEEYEAHLERAYRLCRRCEATLHQKLGEQESWLKLKLLAWKVEVNRLTASKSAQLVRRNLRQKRLPILMSAFLFAAAALVNLHIVANSGMARSAAAAAARDVGVNLFQLHRVNLSLLVASAMGAAAWLFCREGRVSRAMATNLTLWAAVLVSSANVSHGSRLVFESRELLPVLAFLLLPASLAEVFIECLKKEKLKAAKTTTTDVQATATPKAAAGMTPPSSPDTSNHSSLKDATLTQDLLTTSVPTRMTAATSVRSELDSNLLNGSELSLAVPSLFGGAGDRESVFPPSRTSSRIFPSQQSTTSRQKCDISRLSINGSSDEEEEDNDIVFNNTSLRQRRTKSNSNAFARQNYGGQKRSTNAFASSFATTSPAMSPRGSLLKPARFHPSKTSWVAGGYWQQQSSGINGQSPFGATKNSNPLVRDDSRPSSKSSGFISSSERNVNAVNSRPGSLFGGDDLNRSLLFSAHSSQRGGSQGNSSDEDAISQYSAAVVAATMPKPRAQSSPIHVVPVELEKGASWWDRRVSCNVFHLLVGVALGVSLAANALFFLLPRVA